MILEKFKIFIVNLKKDKERRTHIINQLTRQKINNYEIIDAVNGNEFDENEIKKNTFANKMGINPWNTKMSPSQIGCALSHIKIYKKFIKTNYDYALILEDDAIFIESFHDKLINFIINNFKYKKQIILLSEIKQFYSKPINKIEKYELVNVTNAFFTHAYFINKEAAKSIISFNYPVKTIADNFVLFKLYCGIKITGINPFVVDQDKKNHPTTISIEKAKFKKIFLFKRTVYKLKMKFIKFFIEFKSHN
jgi:glycosyl transferase family 25